MGTAAVSPAPAPAQSELSKILGELFTVGVAAASIFVKNPAHQATASSIVQTLAGLLPGLEALL
jgi:hypothetical protein